MGRLANNHHVRVHATARLEMRMQSEPAKNTRAADDSNLAQVSQGPCDKWALESEDSNEGLDSLPVCCVRRLCYHVQGRPPTFIRPAIR
jgi:hypothetical protein